MTIIFLTYVLIDTRRHSSVLDVRSVRGTGCNTGHYLVVSEVRERLTINKQSAQKSDVMGFNLTHS